MVDPPFVLVVLVVAAALVLAVAVHRLGERVRVPAPALFLIAAAAASDLVPALGRIPIVVDERIVTVCLVFILFDGGVHIGPARFRAAAGAIAWLAIAGTLLTAAGIVIAAHLVGLDWTLSLLLGALLSPTDPAVVFAVLGRREIGGRTGTMLEGESGVNDPVGIALTGGVLAVVAGSAGPAGVAAAAGVVVLQLVIGTALGLGGGLALRRLMRRFPLPNESLYPLRTLAGAAVIWAGTTALQGSGFLAVLLAGVVVAGAGAPFQREIERFGAGVAGLAEVVAFVVLGLSISWRAVLAPDVLLPGLAIALLLIVVIRPVLVGVLLLPIRLRIGEKAFVLAAGLRGAVPILLGLAVLADHVAGAGRLYGIVFVVVLVSVLLQGGLAPLLARVLRVPMRTAAPEPYAAGLRFESEPTGLRRHVVAAGSAADGGTVGELTDGHDGWISMVSREGAPLPLQAATRLRAGDVVLTHTDAGNRLAARFDAP